MNHNWTDGTCQTCGAVRSRDTDRATCLVAVLAKLVAEHSFEGALDALADVCDRKLAAALEGNSPGSAKLWNHRATQLRDID